MKIYYPYLHSCPHCGYPESKDYGPYADAERLGIPADLHLLMCGRCSRSFESGPVTP